MAVWGKRINLIACVCYKIGDYVSIGEDSIIQAAQIGSFCEIGKGCVIGAFTIIKDNCKILDGTVIPPCSVIAPFSVWGYREEEMEANASTLGSFIEPLSESWPDFVRNRAESTYASHYQCFSN